MRRLSVSVLVCLSVLLNAQGQVRLPAATLTSPPVIDGVINESEEWSGAPSFGGLRDNATGEIAQEGGKFWIAFDERYIYFAAKLDDSQPGTIKANEYRTNVSVGGDDNVQLYLDLSGSLADFNGFHINPRGATDIQLAGGRAAKREWSGEFTARARITETGWECEARIPWQVMRLPAPGKRNVRIGVIRELKRTDREYTTAYASNQSFQNAGFWEGVSIPRAVVDRTIHVLPYGYLGYGDGEGVIANAGVDVKSKLSEEIPLVFSVNPDFRNIENNILSLDFSRFERLAGETRPFFQEGRQYYNSALFASQRIDSFDAGLNVYGKLNDRISFGVLNTVTFGTSDNLVSNFSYDPNPNESYRITTTSRFMDDAYNDAYLVRYNRVLGPFAVFLRNMGTKDSTAGNGVYNTAGLYFNQGPISTYFQHDAVAPNFVPRLGFAPERDYRGYVFGGVINQPVKWGPVVEAGAGIDGLTYDRYKGGFYRDQIAPNIFLAFKDGTSLFLLADWETFLGSEDHYYQVTLRRPRNNPYNYVSLDYQTGEFSQTYYQSVALRGAWRPTQRLQLTGSLQVADFGGRSEQAIAGINYDLGNDQSLSGRVVKRDDDWNGYLAFRRSGNKGTEYFLILGDPNAQRFRTSLILKVSMPFEIRP